MKTLVLLALVGAVCALPLEPVVDTPEVAQAKAEFKAAFDAAAAAAAAGALPEGVDLATVEDTAEVAAAKAEFQAAFDRAAAAADAAPDFDLDGSLSTYSGQLSTLNGQLSPYFTNTYPYGAFGLHAPVFAGTPLVAGSPLIAGAHVVGSPLTYNAAYSAPFGVFGSPFVQVVKTE